MKLLAKAIRNLTFNKIFYQPRFLKRFYYNISYSLWEHPSNYHWKQYVYGSSEGDKENIIEKLNRLKPGERDIWGGCYYDKKSTEEN